MHSDRTLGFVNKFQFYCCCTGKYSLGAEWIGSKKKYKKYLVMYS